jgi:acylphosphatase
VEAEADGDPDALAAFEAWLHQGPSYAQVDSVDAEPLPGAPRHRGFSIG